MTRLDEGVTITSTERNATEAEYAGGWTHGTSWTVVLRYKGRRMTTPYHMGSAHTGKPEAADVLASLIMDGEGVTNAGTFETWADDMGSDPDSRKAERTYNACERLGAAVRRLLGAEYAERVPLAWDR